VDDTRESPALKIIELLSEVRQKLKIKLAIYDPHVKYFEYELSNFETAFTDADLIAILTEHNEFKYIDPEEVAKLVRNPVIFDSKNLINAEKWKKAGFKVYFLGA